LTCFGLLDARASSDDDPEAVEGLVGRSLDEAAGGDERLQYSRMTSVISSPGARTDVSSGRTATVQTEQAQ
jgi:hypothetical protein